MTHVSACSWKWVAFGALFLCRAASAEADVIFNNFGPGDTYNITSGQAVGGTSYQDVGDRFTVAGASFTLERLALALSYVRGVNAVDVWFMTSVNGVPDFILESWHVTNLPPFGQNHPPILLDSVLHPLLAEGEPYYVIASVPPGVSTDAVWNVNSIGDIGPLAFRQNGGTWFVIEDALGRAALRVEGGAVPEPGSLALLGLGALGLVGYGCQRRGKRR